MHSWHSIDASCTIIINELDNLLALTVLSEMQQTYVLRHRVGYTFSKAQTIFFERVPIIWT